MAHMTRATLPCLFLLAATMAWAQAPDLSGTWTLKTANGEPAKGKRTVTIAQEGAQVSFLDREGKARDVSGKWSGSAFVVERGDDKSGMKLTESWTRQGEQLVVQATSDRSGMLERMNERQLESMPEPGREHMRAKLAERLEKMETTRTRTLVFGRQ